MTFIADILTIVLYILQNENIVRKSLLALVLLSLSISLQAKDIDITKSKGTKQEEIVSLSPSPMDTTVKRGANIKITFDKKLKIKHLQKSMKLKYLGCKQAKKSKLKKQRDRRVQRCNTKFKHNKHLRKSCKQCARELFRYQKNRVCKARVINGNIRYIKNRDILKFNPNRRLHPGFYQVTVKGLKTEDNSKIKKISYRFEVSKNSIENIALSQTAIKLNEDESTKLTLQATYKNGTREDITEDINWIIGDTTLLSIDTDGNLKALKEGETLLQAEYHGKVSQEIKVTITKKVEVINGYTLPPEPDPKINNSTLLGVDVNGNGIRDDVERFIVTKYKDHHKIVTEIGFQGARAYQQILDNPLNTEENHKALMDALDCNHYFNFTAKYAKKGDSVLIDHYIDDAYRDMQLNTKSRVKAYLLYDKQLSGGVYDLTKYSKERSKCSSEVLNLLGGE